MPNMISNGDFSLFTQVVGSSGAIEFVSDDKRHMRVSDQSTSAGTSAIFDLGWVSYGQEYEFKVWGRRVSGKPRVWFKTYNAAGTQINNPAIQYAEMDTSDWKLYTIRYKVNHPDVVRVDINVGVFSADVGEAYFKDPQLSIVGEDYDANFLLPRILAYGTVGWNGTAWEIYASGAQHGISSFAYSVSTKTLTINFNRTYGNSAGRAKYPFVNVSGYTRGGNTYPGTKMITPVIRAVFANRVEITFVDGSNAQVDPATLTGSAYVNLLVFAP